MDKWIIAIKNNNGNIFDLKNLSKFITHEGEHYSCPFIYKYKDINYLFFTDKGSIKCCSINKDMEVSSPINVLKQPYNLSSPYIFEHNKEIYMLPEISGNGIEIYKSVNFPNTWVLDSKLNINTQLYSPIIYKQKEIYYLLSTIRTYRSANYEIEGVQGIGTSENDGFL